MNSRTLKRAMIDEPSERSGHSGSGLPHSPSLQMDGRQCLMLTRPATFLSPPRKPGCSVLKQSPMARATSRSNQFIDPDKHHAIIRWGKKWGKNAGNKKGARL